MCLYVSEILNKTILCFNRILNFVVNIRDGKTYEQKNTKRSYSECSTDRQGNEKYGREKKRCDKGSNEKV